LQLQNDITEQTGGSGWHW